ncbi:Anaphase-promoting complex subunit 6 [Camellia lanceoleosa]|uniref:Anaphase-promoting complex subunit 6 n=1 Tax=Camellia lanceoleosa TaxID=1840588 RepID=A0ACC0FV00_9ERIC|nr:Anaphase-promoting complex subunit 6 [Camellia lanceoleosa]
MNCVEGKMRKGAMTMTMKDICTLLSPTMNWYKKAVWWFEKTLAHIPSLSGMWEPTVINLAHALRKLKRYREAITYYEKALALSTVSLSTYVGLAYTYHLQDNFTIAIKYYHKLYGKPDDRLRTEMLTLALADECRHGLMIKQPSNVTEGKQSPTLRLVPMKER